jgi:anaerobic magnesium-protoporphyrin IX monomethyl ester cyclase
MTERPSIVLFNPSTWRGVGDATAPWGLIALAGLLPEVDFHLVDQRFPPDWEGEVVKLVKESSCILAAATGMTGIQLRGVLNFFSLVKSHQPDLPTMLGGIHASLLPLDTVAHPDIDYVMIGEGEEVLRAFVDELIAGRDPQTMAGTRSNGISTKGYQDAVVWAGCTDFRHATIEDLDKLPRPPHHRFAMEPYVGRTSYGRTLSVLTSRGCPHGCAFCLYSNPQFAGRWRGQTANSAVAWMSELARTYSIDHFHIQDDNFFVRGARVESIVQELASRRPGYTWTVGGAHVLHLRKLPVSFFKQMRLAGCVRLLIGAESGSKAILDRIGKRQDPEDILAVNERLLEAQIRPIYSFISGIPGETDDDLKATVQLMERLRQPGKKVDVGTIKPLVFYPGTDLYQWALDNGFVPPTDVAGWTNVTWDHYLDLPYPWLSQERRRFLIKLYYTSLLWNPDYHWVNSPLFTGAARALMPITRYRMRNLDFRGSLMPDLLRLLQHLALS